MSLDEDFTTFIHHIAKNGVFTWRPQNLHKVATEQTASERHENKKELHDLHIWLI